MKVFSDIKTIRQVGIVALIALFPLILHAASCPVPKEPPPGLSDTSRSIAMTCGGTKVEIACGYNGKFTEIDNRICSNNTLTFTLQNGKVVKPPIPELFDAGSTPVRIGCAMGNDSKYYIPIGYLSGSWNCSKCHVDEIFSIDGVLLDDEPVAEIVLEKNLRNWNDVTIEQRIWDNPTP
jgi:hypothetical protein